MQDFITEIKEHWRAFLAACRDNAGAVLLGYVLLVVTHQVLVNDATVIRWFTELVPYGGERVVRRRAMEVVLYLGVGSLLVWRVHRGSLVRDFGLCLPPRRWVVFTAAIFAVQVGGVLVAAQIPSLRDYYPAFLPARRGGVPFWGWAALQLSSMVAWEFINRGYLLLGLKPRLGMLAVLVQVVPFGILHFGKPVLEIYWSLLDGIGLALLAYASGSIWPAVFLHGVGAFLLDVTLVYIFPP